MVAWSWLLARNFFSKSHLAVSSSCFLPFMPAFSIRPRAVCRAGSMWVGFPWVKSPVIPTPSAILRSGFLMAAGRRSSSRLTRRNICRRVPIFLAAPCWTTLSLKSATLPLEPNEKNGGCWPGSVIARSRMMPVVGIIWKVINLELARHASSRK